MAVAGVVLSRWSARRSPRRRCYRLGGPWAAVAWLFAPTAVFTTVPYTESLFCAAAFWAWERARSDRWLAAALLCAAACTVRVSGLFLVGALLVMIITDARAELADAGRRRAALLIIPAAVIVVFVSYLHLLTGSWTAWYHAQSTGWVRGLTWPWQSFRNTIPAIVPGAFADHPVVGGGVPRRDGLDGRRDAGGGLVPGADPGRRAAGDRRWWGEASWVGVQVLAFSLSYWFFSVNRATLLWFPLWIMLAALGRLAAGGRPRSDGAPGRSSGSPSRSSSC